MKLKMLSGVSLAVIMSLLLAVIPTPTQADPDWYHDDWTYRKKITIDHNQVPSTLTDFPILISRTDADWKDTAYGGHVAQSDGGDILFTESHGTSKLAHEIEKYTPSMGELIV